MSPLAVVQQVYTRYQAIADDTLYLGAGKPRAIFEVFPPNLSLADDDALEATAQQLAVVFNALAFPTQLLYGSSPSTSSSSPSKPSARPYFVVRSSHAPPGITRPCSAT